MAKRGDKSAETGAFSEAHTASAAGDPAASGGADRPGVDAIAADVARLASEIGRPQGEQLDLLAGSLDVDDDDALAAAANLVAAPRRERGRPPGSANRRNAAVFDYLAALGHRDPAVTLSMIQTADTKALAKALGADTAKGRLAVLALQRQAAADLMPYGYAKRPQLVELPPGAPRPVMVIGEMTVVGSQQNAFLSVDAAPPRKASDFNGPTVRHDEDESHGEGQVPDVPRGTGDEATD